MGGRTGMRGELETGGASVDVLANSQLLTTASFSFFILAHLEEKMLACDTDDG
jgi:hypothetical protein